MEDRQKPRFSCESADAGTRAAQQNGILTAIPQI
jgi:hypothetical protein